MTTTSLGGSLRQPLELTLAEENRQWTERITQLMWAFVAVGVAIRLIRFLLKFPLWGDEMLLVENLLDRGYADLTQPLNNFQCAPLLFLGVELTAMKLLGFSEWSMRLFPTLCSIGGLFLFRHVAGRVVRGLPLLLAVAIFAVSFYPVRHGAEIKPYASDLTVSLVLLALAIEAWRSPQQSRWLWLLAAAAPVAIGLSFPAVFVAGGISLGLSWQAWRAGWRPRLALASYNLAIVAAFALFAALSFRGQFDHTGEFMRRYWSASFPPLADPLKLAGWLFSTHTGELFAYPFGGENCGSIVTTIGFAVGVWLLARRRQYTLLGIVAGVFGLALLAAALRRYPYGDNSRLVQYLAPLICLLAGLGWACLVAGIRSANWQRLGLSGAVVALFVCGAGIAVFDMVHPYKHRVELVHRGFARWFWTEHLAGSDVVCLSVPPATGTTANNLERCSYRCLQRIYAPELAMAPPEVIAARVAAARDSQRPIRYVRYSSTSAALDDAGRTAWINEVQCRYDFIGHERFAVTLNTPTLARTTTSSAIRPKRSARNRGT